IHQERHAYFWAFSSIFRAGLSPYEITLYMCLASHADSERRCFPGNRRLAEMCGMSVDKVTTARQRLERAGFIELQPLERENGSRSTWLCKLLDPAHQAVTGPAPGATAQAISGRPARQPMPCGTRADGVRHDNGAQKDYQQLEGPPAARRTTTRRRDTGPRGTSAASGPASLSPLETSGEAATEPIHHAAAKTRRAANTQRAVTKKAAASTSTPVVEALAGEPSTLAARAPAGGPTPDTHPRVPPAPRPASGSVRRAVGSQE